MRIAKLLLALSSLAGCASMVSPTSSDAGAETGSCVACGGDCVDAQCDPRNCGACGVVCAAGETCAIGTCRAPAPSFRWARQFHATSGGATAVASGPGGDIVVGGSVQGPADLGSGVTSGGFRGDAVLARYAPDGSPRWARRFGSPATDSTSFTSIALDPSANVWTAGSFAYLAELGGAPLHAGSFLGGFLAGYDAAGQHRYSMAFTNPPDRPIGGSPDNRFVAVGATADGDAIVGGYFEGPALLGTETLVGGHPDGILARVGPSGQIRWRRVLSGSAGSTVRALATDGAGGAVVAGIFERTASWGTPRTSVGSFDVVVLRVDEHGAPVWTASFGGSGDDFSTSVALDRDGSVYVTGSTAGGFVAGSTTLAGGGAFVVSLSSAGEIRWARLFRAGGAHTSGEGVAVDAARNVVVVGAFDGALDVEGHALGDNGHLQGFAALLSATGDHLWSRAFGGQGSVALHAVAVDPCGGIALAGSFATRVDLGGAVFDAPGPADGFVTLWQE